MTSPPAPRPSGRSARFPAAPLDSQARLVLVAWLFGWFALAAALSGWWVAGGGPLALTATVAVTTAVPLLLLVRLAGLPAAYEVARGALVVRRFLAPARAYRLTGPARRDRGALRLRGRRVLLGGGYGCRTVHWPLGAPDRPERVHLATTSLIDVLRVETSGGPLLVTPAHPDAFMRAVEASVRE